MDCFVGLAVAKATLDLALEPGGEAWSVTNDAAGIQELVSRLAPLAPTLIVLEDPPCHPGGDFLAGELVTQSVPVAHPWCGVRESMQECAVPIRVRLEVGGEIQDREAFSLA